MRALLLLILSTLAGLAQPFTEFDPAFRGVMATPAGGDGYVWVTNGAAFATDANLGRYDTNAYVAFKWTNTTYTSLSKVGFLMKKSGSPTATITVSIYSGAGATPDTLLQTSADTIDSAGLSTSYEERQVSLSYTLTTSTPYWIVWNIGAVSATAYANLETANGTPTAKASADGSSWNNTSGGNRSGRFWVYVK